MFQKLIQIGRAKAGSVTTDWVVLAAVWLFLSIVVANSAFGGVFADLLRLSEHDHPAEQAQSMKSN